MEIIKTIKMNKYIQTYEDLTLNESLTYTSGIKQKHVFKTVQHIQNELLPMLRINESDMAIIGSAGYKPNDDDISHNINIAISKSPVMKKNNNLAAEYVLAFIQDQIKRMGYETRLVNEKQLLYANWPINGLKRNGFVEVQFKITENLEYLKWSRYAEKYSDLNKYSSKHRELLFESIVQHIKKDIREYFDNKHNVRTFDSYLYEADEGLKMVTYTFMGRNGMLKKPSEVFNSKRIISTKPKQITELLFGKNVSENDVKTFDSAIKYVLSDTFPHKKKLKRILETYKSKLISLNYDIPKILE